MISKFKVFEADSKPIKILGAGGLAREITSALISEGFPSSQIEMIALHSEAELPKNSIAILGIGSPSSRSSCFNANRSKFIFPALVSSRADLSSDVEIGEGSAICSGCVITTDVVISKGCYINYQVTIGHDVHIGEFSVVNPGATISGGVEIGSRVLIGANSTVLQNIKIGDDVTIGAGAVVTRDVGDGLTVVGVPARPMFK